MRNISNTILIILLLMVMFFAIRTSLKHFRGEGGCCGGGTIPKIKKQKLNQVIETKRIKIEGIECNHCCKKISAVLNSLDYVNANVSLKRKEAIVKLGRTVSEDILQKTIEEIGYQVVLIDSKV